MTKKQLMLDYPREVLRAVHQWFIHNENEYKSDNELRKLSRKQILTIYLEWEGILGYTHIIEKILECGGYEDETK